MTDTCPTSAAYVTAIAFVGSRPGFVIVTETGGSYVGEIFTGSPFAGFRPFAITVECASRADCIRAARRVGNRH